VHSREKSFHTNHSRQHSGIKPPGLRHKRTSILVARPVKRRDQLEDDELFEMMYEIEQLFEEARSDYISFTIENDQ
jgi:hypothetical protein